MKKFLKICLFLVLCQRIYSQDLVVTGVNFTPTTFIVGQPAVMEVTYAILDITAPAGCAAMFIDLPVNVALASGIGSISSMDGSSTMFDWTVTGNDISGLSNQAILDGGGTFTINVIGAVQGNNLPYSVLLTESFEAGCPPFDDDEGTPNQIALNNLSIGAPLPLDLISFDLQSKDCKSIQLQWQTANERNVDYILLSRSVDGKNFGPIYKSQSINSGSSYEFEDIDVQYGINYTYQIEIVDLDGKSQILGSKTYRMPCIDGEADIKLYPNPSRDNTNLEFINYFEENVNVMVTNAKGALIYNSKTSTQEPTMLNIKHLTPGIYNLRVESSNATVNKRFIKIE